MRRLLFLIGCVLFATSIHAQLNDPAFFPRAVWLQSPYNAQAYKEAGINMFVGLWNDLDSAQLFDLQAAGMYFICDQNEFALNHVTEPLLTAWMHGDEPDNAQWNETTQRYDPCIDPEEVIALYHQYKAKDETHPFYLNLGRGVAHLDWIGRGTCTGNFEMYKEINNGYIAGSDIISFDIYPVNSTDSETSEKLWYVAKGVDSLISWSLKKRPTWTWIETNRISGDNNRAPTNEEVKAEVWMAIIHGAGGIGYFCHSWYPDFDEAALLHNETMLENVSHINSTIDRFAKILNSPNRNELVSVATVPQSIPVDILVKMDKDTLYVFAVQMRPGTCTAIFNIQGASQVEVVNEQRSIDIRQETFDDQFENYEVHIYKIPLNTSKIAHSPHRELSIYPNPAIDIVNLDKRFIGSQYRILDLRGRLVKSGSINDSVLDISDLIAGPYVLNISTTVAPYFYTGKLLKLEK